MTFAQTAPLELQDVLAIAAVSPPGRVEFREERHNPMLKMPLVLTGYLEYLEPGVLRKVILTPGEQSFLITGDEIVIDRRGQEQRLPLKRSRALKAILGAIEAILAGKAEDLESVFTYELTGTTDSWSVHLVPVSKRMSRQLTSMQISGDTAAATSIRFDLQDGEWHQTTLLRDDPDH